MSKEIHGFLQDCVGYGPLSQGDSLEGTILGSVPIEKNKMGGVLFPRIYDWNDFAFEAEGKGKFSADVPNAGKIFFTTDELDMGLKNLIFIRNAFYKENSDGINTFFDDVREHLPSADYRLETETGDNKNEQAYTLRVTRRDLYLRLQGSFEGNTPKILTIMFNTEKETVDRLNEIVNEHCKASNCGWMLKNNPLDPLSSKMPTSETYDRLLDSVLEGKLTYNGLKEELKNCKAAEYDQFTEFFPGQVVNQFRFGKGIIVKTGPGTSKRYDNMYAIFPSMGEPSTKIPNLGNPYMGKPDKEKEKLMVHNRIKEVMP
ncbi:hypothetical protein KY366_00555 [Candidatus Woesearchaeota archaeon]|nr:hypothetical protein [Candidatus Woesearchaeota archaeon]